jgi:hypothetical protein
MVLWTACVLVAFILQYNILYLYGLLALLLTSGAGLAGIFFYKRRKMKKS